MKLWSYVIRRLLLLVPVLVGITLVTFTLSWVATDGHLETQYLRNMEKGDEAKVQRIIEENGFDEPAHVQYFNYLERLFHGDLGHSTTVNRPVAEVVAAFFPATFELALVGMTFALVIGIPLGILSAVKRNRPTDHAIRFVALSGVSVPVFWLALLLQLYLGYRLNVDHGIDFFPLQGRFDPNVAAAHPILFGEGTVPIFGEPTGFLLLDTVLIGDWIAFYDVARHLILPGFTLAFTTLAVIARMMRSSMLEELSRDYVRTARAKGLSESAVIHRHARRNALLPTVTVVGIAFGGLLNGAVLTETIFAWPGLGRWATSALLSVDTAAIMGFVLLTTLIYVLANLIVDVAYALLDPRIRLG